MMMISDYALIKVKKLCPMCVMHVGTIPHEQLKLCTTHRREFNERKNTIWSNRR